MDSIHKTGTVYQMAFLVDNLAAAAEDWRRRGAGPFYRFDDFEFSEMLYPGGSASPRLSILLGYSGDTMIELIQVGDDPTGLFSGLQAPAAHHVALLVEDIDSYLDANGNRDQLAMHGLFPTGTPIAMLDSRAETGLITELVTLDDSVRGMISLMRAEASAFSGKDLLRSFG
jgi:methylmalonyl-CoA/ethylmalonyl-CoA epimerase